MDELLQSIVETATWIDKVNPRFEDNFFRSEELRPTGIVLDWTPGFQPQHFESVLRKRRQQLQQRGVALLQENELLDKGRLILTNPVDSIYDGYPGLESQGYFDYYELPPWDTWVCLTNEVPGLIPQADYVVAWVPNAQQEGVHYGRAVCMMDNISWLHELRATPLNSATLNELFAEPQHFPAAIPLSEQEIDARLDYIEQHKSVARR